MSKLCQHLNIETLRIYKRLEVIRKYKSVIKPYHISRVIKINNILIKKYINELKKCIV